MRFKTFLVSGIEVLQLGGQNWQSNAWPPEHWKEHKGRFRLFTVAIDEQVNNALKGRNFGGLVEGVVVALEVADFSSWPETTFAKKGATPSFKPKHRDLWCIAKLDWNQIKDMTLKQQHAAYTDAVFESIALFEQSKRKPKGFLAAEFNHELRAVLKALKPSTLTRAAHAA